MNRYALIAVLLTFALCPASVIGQDVIVIGPDQEKIEQVDEGVTQGALRVKTEAGEIVECPLKHTDVGAMISGFIARVKVVQTFENPFDERIEAVYVFPLPHTAAVDDMTMIIGERRIIGVIKRRAVARRIYEQALAAGMTASLLEQERPNIFTQSVGNIDPGQEIKIEISYLDVLAYDMGVYEFHFPMVVGPRYIPGSPISKKPHLPPELEGKVGEIPDVTAALPDPSGTGWSPDTGRVPDASRITPPVLKPGFRTGHDIALFVTLDAGVPIQDLEVPSHEAEIKKTGDSRADVRLSPNDSIPNKDFVLRYEVAGPKPEMALLAHSPTVGEGYFMLMMQPKVDEAFLEAPPREIVFLIDVSGSMRGLPTAQVKAEMTELLHRVKPEDKLQVITFAGSTSRLFEQSLPATDENIKRALDFTQSRRAGGGTEMLKGIQEVLKDPVDPERKRIVIMLTDGFIGNENEIIKEVGERCGDMIRFWVIGIGNSVNRHLVDGVAKQGGGMGKVLGLNEDPMPLAGEIMERIHQAQLANIEIDWGSLAVYETYPAKIPDLWAGRPVILFGRYEAGGASWIKIKGLAEGEPAEFPLYVSLPEDEPQHEVLGKVWARKKIADLMVQNYMGNEAVEEEITLIALRYRLMSQFTSFVAVDESEERVTVEPLNPPRRIPVAVPLPAGVSYEGVFGSAEGFLKDFNGNGVLAGVDNDWYCYAGAPAGSGSRSFLFASPAAKSMEIPATGVLFVVPHDLDKSRARAYAAAPSFRGYNGRYVVSAETRAQLGSVRMDRNKSLAAGRMTGGVPARAADSISFGIADEAPLALSWSGEGPAAPPEELRETAAKNHAAAEARINAASRAETVADLEAARTQLRLAFLLEHGFLAVYPWSDQGLQNAVLGELEILQEKLIDQHVKENPKLGTTLDLILRHEKLDSALEKIGKAAGIEIQLIEGSEDDVKELLLLPELSITYQDLRGANVAQALTWIAAPLNLEWRETDDGTVLVGAARRLDGPSPWVYQVGDLLIPTKEELGETEEDPAKQQEKVHKILRNSIDAFEDVVDVFRSAQAEFGPGTVELITPGELLVYGDAKLHRAIEGLLTNLHNPDFDPTIRGLFAPKLGEKARKFIESLEKLHAMTAPRWEARKELRGKRIQRAALARAAGLLADGSWRLLAAAANGEVDPEAAAELEAAWRSEEIDTILSKGNHQLAYRALFAITQAARTLADNEDLRRLASEAVKKAANSFKVPEEKAELPQLLGTVYAVLAFKDAAELGIENLPSGETMDTARKWVLEAREKVEQPLAASIALAMLKKLSEKESAAFADTIRKKEFAGTDLLVLEALVARRLGGETWQVFRQEMPDMIGQQAVDGEAVVLVNRLATAALPIVKG